MTYPFLTTPMWEPDIFTSTYRKFITGSVPQFYDFLKTLINSALTALSIPEGDLTWAYERDGQGNPSLMVVQTKDFRVRVTSGPYGLDLEVCRLGREVGRAGEQVYKHLHFRLYQARYLGITQVKEGRLVVCGSGWNLRTAR
ncbi:uncharacterized protein LOC135477836 [Liolophura sinensis]|uniref:uncharacterized protein LOC135477836 n=1 Tax=Liolophura sinensis TaxID=3198878 RepID=UPI00315870DC